MLANRPSFRPAAELLGTALLGMFANLGVALAGDRSVKDAAVPEACCFAPTGCLDLEPATCAGLGGVTPVPSTNCAASNCSSSGACCQGGACSDGLSQFMCESGGGTFQGDGTTCLADEGPGASCSDGLDNDCDGSADCADPGCAGAAACVGACCASDGVCTGGGDAAACASAGGTYQGNGTTCTPNPCPPPSGACCTIGGGCAELTQSGCDVVPNAGWAGPLTTCSDTFPPNEIPGIGNSCCDGLDNDCDGMADLDDAADCPPDACSPPVEPPLPADPPHNRVKNRYISFKPNPADAADPLRYRITRTYPLPALDLGWVGPPDAGGLCLVLPDSQMPAMRLWTETVIHVGDCEIYPVPDTANAPLTCSISGAPCSVACGVGQCTTGSFGGDCIPPPTTYELRATKDNVVYSDPLVLTTVPRPCPKKWGDLVGAFENGAWTPPNGVCGTNDFLAILQSFQVLPQRPHVSVTDVVGSGIPGKESCVNKSGGMSDVFRIIKAFQGEAYPFATDPTQCPDCP
ncbi:MAG: hypothetical protein HY763_01400 [Planctomycetes bacterium]|nr:hypothetical protein [Planctomycetota bacterium]